MVPNAQDPGEERTTNDEKEVVARSFPFLHYSEVGEQTDADVIYFESSIESNHRTDDEILYPLQRNSHKTKLSHFLPFPLLGT